MPAQAYRSGQATINSKVIANVENITISDEVDMFTATTSGDRCASLAWVENCRSTGQIQSSDLSQQISGPKGGEAGIIEMVLPQRKQGSGDAATGTGLKATAANGVVGNVGIQAPGSGNGSLLTIDFTATSPNGSDDAITYTADAAA